MHTITAVLFDETETDTFSRVTHLMPLAYPTSAEPPHLRPADVAAVDVRDPRLRVISRLAERPYQPVIYPQVVLAHEALTRLVEVLEPQANPTWWQRLLQGRTVRPEDEQMAHAMAAERAGQVPRAVAAARVIDAAMTVLSPVDDPAHWRADDR